MMLNIDNKQKKITIILTLVIFFILILCFMVYIYFFKIRLYTPFQILDDGESEFDYKQNVSSVFVDLVYRDILREGNIRPGEKYYGPLNSNIYTFFVFPERTKKIPQSIRSLVPVDVNKSGNWAYYGCGVRGHACIYYGEPVNFVTDGENYFGLIWADDNGKYSFKPQFSNESLSEFQLRIKNDNSDNYNIFWVKKKGNEVCIYNAAGFRLIIEDDSYYSIKRSENIFYEKQIKLSE